jgi:hypothetical protein
MPPVAILGRSLAKGNTGVKSGEGAKALTSGTAVAQPPRLISMTALKSTPPKAPKVFWDGVDSDDRAVNVFIKIFQFRSIEVFKSHLHVLVQELEHAVNR